MRNFLTLILVFDMFRLWLRTRPVRTMEMLTHSSTP